MPRQEDTKVAISDRLAPITVPCHVFDPGADDRVPLFRASCTCEIVGIYVVMSNGVTATTSVFITAQIEDGGSAGSGTTAIASRGSKTTGFTAETIYEYLTASDTPHQLDKGDWVFLDYDESGTCAPGVITSNFEIVRGTID